MVGRRCPQCAGSEPLLVQVAYIEPVLHNACSLQHSPVSRASLRVRLSEKLPWWFEEQVAGGPLVGAGALHHEDGHHSVRRVYDPRGRVIRKIACRHPPPRISRTCPRHLCFNIDSPLRASDLLSLLHWPRTARRCGIRLLILGWPRMRWGGRCPRRGRLGRRGGTARSACSISSGMARTSRAVPTT